MTGDSVEEVAGGTLEGDSEVVVDVFVEDSVEVFSRVPVVGACGGFEGVFAAEGVGVAGAGCPPNERLSLISPYSFHSSTSSRSYTTLSTIPISNTTCGFIRSTYCNDHTHPYQTWQFLLPRSSTPQHSSLFICGDIEGVKWDFVGFEDGFKTGGSGNDVRRASGERSVEVEGGICVVGFRSRRC